MNLFEEKELKILVVGATGQLGSAVVAQAILAGHEVRALVRADADIERLQLAGATIVLGDLRDKSSLREACRGMDGVIATASMVFPRGILTFEEVERDGYRNLLDACLANGVSRLLYVSIAMPQKEEYLRTVPTLRFKAETEERIRSSGLCYTTFRCAPFMDDYFALMGSEIPLRGELSATLKRASGITRIARIAIGRSIDRWGIALVPGSPQSKHAFVAVEDVAGLMVASLIESDTFNRTIEVSGPRAVSWREICGIYESIRGAPVVALSLPAWLLRQTAKAIASLMPVEANQIGLLRVLASEQSGVQRLPSALAGKCRHLDPEAYLREKSKIRPQVVS
ncbi:NmrA family NAD(P)-binding protein [Xanthomonas sp. 3075]|uniref:SDR family oxidoreductase n=1 Tax=Xanthomonas sp. 3075 TaxID=3035315 RepID=UPI0016192425|nr:NmrA family NAD(P)-binding protein [Xanthomonas sp. 3075]MBB4133356.1 uncharacterized protein YbjT (DUF2867 family) [Xanthomonas sp. 3075]